MTLELIASYKIIVFISLEIARRMCVCVCVLIFSFEHAKMTNIHKKNFLCV